MENNQQSKWIWGLVAIIIVIGLILIAKKSNNTTAPNDDANKVGINDDSANDSASGNTAKNPASTKSLGGGLVASPTKNIVEYTNAGFSPFILNVNRGESVEFINKSDKVMTIRSREDNQENFYPGFSQEGGPLGKGGKFYFTFTTPGAWAYYNLNGNHEEGVIYVK